MDLTIEILLNVVDNISLQDICSLRLANRWWRDFVATHDAKIFKTRCEKFGDLTVRLPDNCPESYFNKLCFSPQALIEARLDKSSFTERKPVYCQAVVILRDRTKYDSSLITWKIDDITPPLFVVKNPTDNDVPTSDMTGMNSPNWFLDDGQFPIIEYPVKGSKWNPAPLKRDFKLEVPWGSITLTFGRYIPTLIQGYDFAGAKIHEFQLTTDNHWPINFKYTRNDLLIIISQYSVTWYKFSSDGKDVSESFTQDREQLAAYIQGYDYGVGEKFGIEFTHSHLLISYCDFNHLDAECPHLYTCSYESMRQCGIIQCRKLVSIMEDSDYLCHFGPYYTEVSPRYIFYHAAKPVSFHAGGIDHYILWCIDLLYGEIRKYAYDRLNVVYLDEHYNEFSPDDEKLLREYHSMSSLQWMPLCASNILADREKLDSLPPVKIPDNNWWDKVINRFTDALGNRRD